MCHSKLSKMKEFTCLIELEIVAKVLRIFNIAIITYLKGERNERKETGLDDPISNTGRQRF